MVTEPSNYVVHPRVCVKWEEKGRATKKNGKEWQETDHGVRTATKRRRRKRRTVAKAAGAQVRAQTYPHGFPTRWPLEILGEPLHRAGSRETTSGLAELGEEWGGGGRRGGQLLEQTPAPCFLAVSPFLLLPTCSTSKYYRRADGNSRNSQGISPSPCCHSLFYITRPAAIRA